MKKEIISILCSLFIGLSVFPMTALAESDTEIEKIMDQLSKHGSLQPVDEWQIKPAETSEDGSQFYVSLLHLQELDGLLVRCSESSALQNISGNRLIFSLAEFLDIHDQVEQVDGKTRDPEKESISSEYDSDGLYVIDFCFGVFPNQTKQQQILESVFNNPYVELMGILQTDWYVKGYFDDMNTVLYIVPEEGCEINAEELNTEEYSCLELSSQLSDSQMKYIRDLPSNTYCATMLQDNKTFEEVAELCERLESRDDIAYAWIAPVYLEDKLANDGVYCYSVLPFSSEQIPDETNVTTSSETTGTETTGAATSETTETAQTAETTAEEPAIETPALSDETLCEWAAKDYSDKHQKAVTAAVTAKEEGKVIITLTDSAGKEVDTYVLDAESGIGANADGEEINLPQTGNNSISNYLLALTAVFLVGGGVVMLVTSGMIRRKKENE